MNFTTSDIAKALAAHLSPVLPGVTFYENPNQQSTSTPCCFLQQRSASISNKLGDRYLRTIKLDLTYLEDYNLTDLQERYEAVAEILDYYMETFSYNGSLIRTYDRNWSIDLDALHYKFEIRVWVTIDHSGVIMESLDINEEVKDGR